MFYVGLAISGFGLVLYVVSAILLNYYLRRNRPDVLEQLDSKSGGRKKQKRNKDREVRVVVTENATPGWVALLGFPAIPMFLVGIAG